MKNLIFISLGCSIISLSSCTGDKTNPEITITYPASNSTVIIGDTMHITGNVTDNNELEEVDVHVVNLTTKDTVRHDHHSMSGKSFGIVTDYITTDPGNYSVYIEAGDAAGNIADSEIPFMIK